MSNDIATFVIPVYVKSDIYLNFLEEAIQGIINQTDKKWNAVFIEDCSPVKEVRKILNKYSQDKRIHSIFLKMRKTTGACRNIGIEWAKNNNSPYILFNDADDVPDRNRVKWIKEIFKSNLNVDVIYSDVNIIDEYSNQVDFNELSPAIKEIVMALKDNPPRGRNCWLDIGLRTGYVNITSTTSVRTELAAAELFPDEYVSEDSHTWFRYAARGEYYFDNNIHAKYRIPTFVKRQSSEGYVDDFNVNKLRVEREGYSKAIEIALQNGSIDKDVCSMIEVKFVMRLIESMKKVNRYDLACDLAAEYNKKLKQILL